MQSICYTQNSSACQAVRWCTCGILCNMNTTTVCMSCHVRHAQHLQMAEKVQTLSHAQGLSSSSLLASAELMMYKGRNNHLVYCHHRTMKESNTWKLLPSLRALRQFRKRSKLLCCLQQAAEVVTPHTKTRVGWKIFEEDSVVHL